MNFQKTIMFRIGFMSFLSAIFEFCWGWGIYSWFFGSHFELKLQIIDFQIRTLDFKLQKSKVPTELLYLFVCEMETLSKGPLQLLFCNVAFKRFILA